MLVRGSILLAALLTGAGAAATNATPIKEIPEDVIDGVEQQVNDSRGLQSRYGESSGGGYQTYTTPDPTPKPSTYTAPSSTGTGSTRQVYTDEDGRTYVIRKRNGVENKVYTDTPGWNTGGRQYRQRTGTGGTRVRTGNRRPANGSRVRNGNRKKRPGARPGGARPGRQWSPPTPAAEKWSPPTPNPTNKWSPPTPPPTKWSPPTPPPTPNGWRPGYPNIPSYQGNYNPSYKKTADPTAPQPTEVPTWDSGHGKCVEPFKSACCIQDDHYSFDQKQNLCKKLGCDYLQCNKDLWNDDAWKSGNEPTAVPTWDTDGHDPTAMPTWDTDGWEDDTWSDEVEECVGAARTACCSQTKGDELTKSKMCERLKCDYNKCQKEPGWKGDTHEPSEQATEEPSNSPSVSGVPTWSADGYDEKDDDWTGDGQCSKEEQDRCCSQHESKSLEIQAKNCKNKFGCSVFKCPQYRQGADGWYGDSFEDLEWDDDGHLDDTCTPNEQEKCCEQHDGISITKQQQICKNMWNCSLLKCSKHRQSDYFEKKDDGYYEDEKDDGYYEDVCSKDDMISCCSQHPDKPFAKQYTFCTKRGCDLHKCDVAWYEEDEDRCTDEEHYACCNQSDDIGTGIQHENCVKDGCSLFKCTEEEDEYNKPQNKWDQTEKPKFQYGYGGDDSTCPDSRKWKCCSPDQSISGSYKSIVKNCQDLGCEWAMCPQNRDDSLYDNQSYYDSYYEYGGGYDDNDQCTDAGKWNCCNPDESLSGLKAWVRNCQAYSCEWQKCPHHRQGYYDPMKPTVNKDEYDGPPPPEPTYGPTPSPVLQCSNKEQMKCCNYQGTLKEAAKYCQSLECDIADCNKPSGGYPNYNGGGYSNSNKNDGGYFNIDVRNDNYVTYGDGDRPQGNKGPNPNNGSNSGVDYGSYGGGDDRPQGNKGPNPNTSDSAPDYVSNEGGDRPQGNKGPKDTGVDTNDKGDNFLNQGVDENCTREYTAGGACREVCTAKVEYKLMGIVMSTHDETTTRPCS